MFPPPITTQISTPSSWISFTWRQVRSRVAASIGSPDLPPCRISPESFRMMRLYFTRGSTGRDAVMSWNETMAQIKRQPSDCAAAAGGRGPLRGWCWPIPGMAAGPGGQEPAARVAARMPAHGGGQGGQQAPLRDPCPRPPRRNRLRRRGVRRGGGTHSGGPVRNWKESVRLLRSAHIIAGSFRP